MNQSEGVFYIRIIFFEVQKEMHTKAKKMGGGGREGRGGGGGGGGGGTTG